LRTGIIDAKIAKIVKTNQPNIRTQINKINKTADIEKSKIKIEFDYTQEINMHIDSQRYYTYITIMPLQL